MVKEKIELSYKIAHTPFMVDANDQILVTTDSDNILRLNEAIGEGFIERVQLNEGLSIQITKFKSNHHIEIKRIGTTDSDLLILDFHIKGLGSLDVKSERNTNLRGDQFSYGAYFAHSNIESKGIFPANNSNEQIHIVINKNWLFSEFSEVLVDILGKSNLTGSFFIFERLNAKLIEVVHEIMTSNNRSEFRKSYLKGKALELLTLFFSELDKRGEYYHIDELNSLDIARLFELESYIKENLNTDLSVFTLSNHIGFSQSKLQKLFKHVYGKSVHKKINEIKMIKSLELLESKEMTVSQIGYQMGYRNMSHFSAAFRKVHGFLPSEY